MCIFTCLLDNIPVKLTLDTGGCASLLSAHNYELYFKSQILIEPADVTLPSYDGSPIECIGIVEFNVQYENKYLQMFAFYVTELGSSTMRINLLRELHFKLLNPCSQIIVPVNVHVNTQISLEQFPAMLKDTGELKYFEHEPMVDPNVKLVLEPYRPVPLVMREAIADELQRVKRESIIEKIDFSPFVSNCVVVKKKTEVLEFV